MKDYNKEWAKLDSLTDKGMTRDALTLTEEIYALARAEGNDVQQVKAILHKMGLSAPLQERSDSINFELIKKEIANAKHPIKNILQSIEGDMYFRYFQRNRWQIINRTAVSIKPEDFQTWDAKTLMERAGESFLISLEEAKKLQKLPIEEFEALLNKGKESATYRPTLYDLLAHRALDFFSNTQTGLATPANEFEWEVDNAFLPARQFVKKEFTSPDPDSRVFKAVQLYQEILAFHTQSKNTYALIDADLKRLAFAKEHTVGEGRDEQYQRALADLLKEEVNHPASALVSYKLAQLYVNMAGNYAPLQGDDHKWDNKTAYTMCQDAIDRHPNSEGANQCKNLQQQIQNKSLDMTLEDANIPETPFRALIRHRNVNQVYFRTVAFTDALEKRLRELGYSNRKDMAEVLRSQPVIQSWQTTLPSDGDYQTHSIEVKVPAMPAGAYLIMMSDDSDFTIENHAIGYATTQVTELSFFSQELDKKLTIFVRNRDTGKPLKKVKVRRIKQNYRQGGFMELGLPKRTDKYGEVTFNIDEKNRDYILELSSKNDFYRSDRMYTSYYRPNKGLPQTVTRLFTDRTIYRPGQTIYFKGIVMDEVDGKYTIKPNAKSKVIFYDANHQEVKTLEVKTNEYGTYSGSFTAPTTGLTGQMRIQGENGNIYFNVEEYKRPKFEVSFEPVKGSFSLGDEVTATGKAMAYAGSVVDGAEVKYRVIREARFPYWGYFFWWRPAPSSPSREITSGVATTNEKGEFEVTFTMLPDRSLSKDSKPIFAYKIIADVVDITGETRTGETRINAGYIALDVGFSIPKEIFNKDKKEFKISTKNLNGEFEPAKGTVNIYKLKGPDKVLTPRLWSQPDQFLYSEKEFKTLFPDEVYKDENKVESWEKGTAIATHSFDTKEKKEIALPELGNAGQGKYLVELMTKDKNGEEILLKKYITVLKKDSKQPPIPDVLYTRLDKSTLEPGERATLTILGSVKKLTVVYKLEKDGKVLDEQRIKLNGKPIEIEVPITEAHRGGLHYTLAAIYHDQFHQEGGMISVPWTNKQLTLEWGTFRSKLKPGAEETWTLKIKGPKGDKVAAEMVAGMYDASLDAFSRSNSFGLSLYSNSGSMLRWVGQQGFGTQGSRIIAENWNPNGGRSDTHSYDQLNTFGFALGYNIYGGGGVRSRSKKSAGRPRPMASPAAPAMEMEENAFALDDGAVAYSTNVMYDSDEDGVADVLDKEPATPTSGGEAETPLDEVSIRTNLNETAFFFPHLMTDADGNIEISFTMPEALTKWKFMSLTHTKDLKVGTHTDEVVTQKELMVMPNMPRFLRQGDKIKMTAKVSNLTEQKMVGSAQLILLDAFTMEPIGNQFDHIGTAVQFTAEAGQSAPLSWEIEVPETVQAVVTQVVARAGEFSDGEEQVLPILSNRMLVTESMPLPIRGNETKEFTFEKLVNSGSSSTLRHQQLTLEFTSNPAWYAVQALPYLMEYPHDCSEQIFSRYYANALASHIATSTPKIQRIFEQWKTQGADAKDGKSGLLSNLATNQDLKSVLLAETPWVLNATDESERKKRVGLLFDLNRMADESARTRDKLSKMQNATGAFPWFPGMRDNRYITTLIATGMGHLNKMGVGSAGNPEINQMMSRAIPYLDREIQKDYDRLLSYAKGRMDKKQISNSQIQYLYMRSFFPDIQLASGTETAFNYYYAQAKEFWPEESNYMKGMISIVLSRRSDAPVAKTVIESLRQNAIDHPELGMYWKQNNRGYWWYQAPLEQHSLLIQAFDEVDNDQKSVEAMKIWLLKNKQTNDWKTTRATVAACNALLMSGANLLESDQQVAITMGGETVDPYQRDDAKVEAGTGYFKTAWNKGEISPQMGTIKLEKKDPGVAWGALYWQYFEDMDKITFAATPLSIQKALFVEEITQNGPKLNPIDSKTLKPGDKIIVRIELRVDRDMEYVHMKDMRASGFEPINVLSQYKYQDGLGYYESTKDVATHFFFGHLTGNKTYVFEYPLRVSHTGDFSNGITTIQCMYAPEYTSHSEGLRVKVK